MTPIWGFVYFIAVQSEPLLTFEIFLIEIYFIFYRTWDIFSLKYVSFCSQTSAISCTPAAGFLKAKQRAVNLVQFAQLPERETHIAINFKAVCSRPDLEIALVYLNINKSAASFPLQVRPE